MTTALLMAPRNAQTTQADPRWAQVRARDASADGRFVYAVASTGVYCRPSCAARPARPENVSFYATPAAAARAGFRACLRCKPDGPSRTEEHAADVAELCRFIEQAETPPSLDELAARARLSPQYLHRVFRSITGVTPRAYAQAHRAHATRARVKAAPSVTAAIYDAGYSSSSRFYEQANDVLGMTPSAYRAGGADVAIDFAVGECSLGSILVARTDRGICAIALGDDADALVKELQDRFPAAALRGGDRAFEKLVAQVIGLVEAPGTRHELPLDVRGTAFQRRVWEALRTIPAGTTLSYAELAAKIGSPGAVRAVGAACGANTLAIAIPCHRVVRTDGSLSGYRWGVERKRELLKREGA